MSGKTDPCGNGLEPAYTPKDKDNRPIFPWVTTGNDEVVIYALRSAELFADAYLSGQVEAYEARWRADFGRELRRAARMRRRFYGNFLGGPFTARMIDFARLHPGVRRTLRELVAGHQGYLGLKRTLARRVIWPL